MKTELTKSSKAAFYGSAVEAAEAIVRYDSGSEYEYQYEIRAVYDDFKQHQGFVVFVIDMEDARIGALREVDE